MSDIAAYDKRDGCYWYHFTCEGCGASGDMGVEVGEHGSFGCPEGCGATYIQWHPTGHMAALKCVVCPIFEKG